MTNTPNTTSVLSVRVNPDERAILEAAAAEAHTSLSDFMRRKSLEAAEVEMLNRSIVTIPAKDWEAFEAWVDRPAEAIPAGNPSTSGSDAMRGPIKRAALRASM